MSQGTIQMSANSIVTQFPNHRLTRKQETFIAHYVSAAVSMNGTEAARRAGYKGNAATLANVAAENLRKPYISEEIDRRMAIALSATGVTVEKVLRDIEGIMTRAMEKKQYASAVRCVELQGKYLGMFSNRIKHSEAIEDISTEKLLELIREIAQAGDIDLLDLLARKEPL